MRLEEIAKKLWFYQGEDGMIGDKDSAMLSFEISEQLRRLEIGVQEHEVERQVQLVTVAVEARERLGLAQARLVHTPDADRERRILPLLARADAPNIELWGWQPGRS